MQTIISVVTSARFDNPIGIKPTDISKLWIISETLAEGLVKRETHLTRNKSNNFFPRNFMTNHRIPLYRIIQNTFFSDTVFATLK